MNSRTESARAREEQNNEKQRDFKLKEESNEISRKSLCISKWALFFAAVSIIISFFSIFKN